VLLTEKQALGDSPQSQSLAAMPLAAVRTLGVVSRAGVHAEPPTAIGSSGTWAVAAVVAPLPAAAAVHY
jgi:hypothetical protein